MNNERDGGRCVALDIRLFLHLLPDSGSRIRWTLRAGDGDERDRKEVEMNGWTKIEDRLPKYSGKYQVACKVKTDYVNYREVRIYFFERIESRRTVRWIIPANDDEVVTITHWAPALDLPEDE